MNITHLIFSFKTGGAQTMLVDIVNVQVNFAKVSIIIINKSYNKTLIDKIDRRVKLFFINRDEGSKNPYSIIRINLLLLKLRSNVLHCHNHNIIPLLLPGFRKKTMLTLHCMGIPAKYLNKYSQLFAISESVKKDIKDRAKKDSTVIYNGIYTEGITAKENWLINSIFKIICVGRLSHLIKGQHLAIEALHILKKTGVNNIQLDLIGTGESESYLKELTTKYGLNEQVSFLGLKDRDYIYAHLKDYDLLVQPSLFEGFGLTVAEGMAAKISVLVSNVDGPMEIIDNGKYGYSFSSGNAEEIASKIISIMNTSPNDIRNKIELAYEHVKNNFDISLTAKNYIENY